MDGMSSIRLVRKGASGEITRHAGVAAVTPCKAACDPRGDGLAYSGCCRRVGWLQALSDVLSSAGGRSRQYLIGPDKGTNAVHSGPPNPSPPGSARRQVIPWARSWPPRSSPECPPGWPAAAPPTHSSRPPGRGQRAHRIAHQVGCHHFQYHYSIFLLQRHLYCYLPC